MQPYFLPYVGYWQLMASVDRFVILDDVAFPTRGWVHRNRMLVAGRATWFGLHVAGASQRRRIDELHLAPDGRWRRVLIRTLEVHYARAAHGAALRAWLDEHLHTLHPRLVDLLLELQEGIRARLGLRSPLIRASTAHPRGALSGVERVLDICRREGAATYVNAPGGVHLYDPERFAASGIALEFLQPPAEPRSGGVPPGCGPLSILHHLMHLHPDVLAEHVAAWRTVRA